MLKPVCVLKGTRDVHGVVYFQQESDGLVTVDALLSDGKHSFHMYVLEPRIAGPHFNPKVRHVVTKFKFLGEIILSEENKNVASIMELPVSRLGTFR
uniref:Uncharacterized protein n=1 Tax=Leptobrachium leishanense TaxID=445787 RepID=A0A8C5WCL5_9ANUR